MVVMLTSPVLSTLLVASLLAGLPWIRSGSTTPAGAATQAATGAAPEAPVAAASDRVVLLGIGEPEYRALAIPRSYQTAPDAPLRLLVFRGGLCVRDLGLGDAQTNGENSVAGTAVVEQRGISERAFVAPDGQAAVVVKTRYVSRVDVTRGQTSVANDTVTGETTLTLVDPGHPDGWWRVTLENARWAKDALVLPAGRGVVVTTFLPRNGPTDVRILDAKGRESVRVPESLGETTRIEASPDGGYVAADVTYRDNEALPERGVIVFDLVRGTQWTYGWRYGSDAEPISWSLLSQGILDVKLPGSTRRFDATGRKL